MDTGNNIGEVFREAFKDFERKPSNHVWTNIESKAKAPSFYNKLIRNNANLLIGSAAIIIVASLAYFLLNQTNNNTNLNNKSSIVNNNIYQTQNTNNTSLNNNKQIVANTTDSKNTTPNNVNEIVKTKDTVGTTTSPKPTNYIPKQVENNEKPTNVNTPATTIPKTNNINSTTNTNSQKPQTNKNYNVVANNPVDNTTITFTPDQTICKGDKVKLEVKGGASYLWSTGERTQYVLVNPTSTTDYSVIVTDSKGAIKSGLITVNVSDCEALMVPNAFAPNGEGKAAIFKAYGNNIRNFEMIVYSRSGQMVFSSKNIDEGWNGTFSGNNAPMGVYVYRISYIDQLNTPHILNGHVSLIR